MQEQELKPQKLTKAQELEKVKAELAEVKALKSDHEELEKVKAELEALKNKPLELKGKIKANLNKKFEINAKGSDKAYYFAVTFNHKEKGSFDFVKKTDVKTIHSEQFERTGEKFMTVLKSSKGFETDGTAKCVVEMIHNPNK